MIVDNEPELAQTLQMNDNDLMIAENKNFEENKDNVLFEPKLSDFNNNSTTIDQSEKETEKE
jgi:hypothetical protein